jgi:hypothetical protein
MSIQNIIDRAQQIEIDRKKFVGQTMSRSQRIKTSERSTAQPWRFKITPPGALKWADSRGFIEVIDSNDRINEYEISLNNNAAMNYITAYQGGLSTSQVNSLTIFSTGTSTMSITGLPSIGATISTRSTALTAWSFSAASSTTYRRAFSTTRNDFLITTADYNTNWESIKVGDTLNTSTYVTGGQTISSIDYNYITINSVSYSRIVMSAVANANSTQAITDGQFNIVVDDSFSQLVTSSTVILSAGDFIQSANSRYPYTVTTNVVRGSNTTTNVTLNRPIISSEGISLNGQTLNVGNSCTWQVVVATLPTYQLIPNRLVQYTGDFELIEKII